MIKELKQEAKNRLQDKWNKCAFFGLLHFLFNSILLISVMKLVMDLIDIDNLFLSIGIEAPVTLYIFNIFTSVTDFGYAKFLMNIAQKRERFSDLFYPFRSIRLLYKLILLEIYKQTKIFLYSLLFLVPGIMSKIKFELIHYCMVQNETLSFFEILRLNKKITKGETFRLIKILISFIPIYLLTLFSFGILGFWLEHYIKMTLLVYYEKLRTN